MTVLLRFRNKYSETRRKTAVVSKPRIILQRFFIIVGPLLSPQVSCCLPSTAEEPLDIAVSSSRKEQ